MTLIRRDVAHFPDVAQNDDARLHVIELVLAVFSDRRAFWALKSALHVMAPDDAGARLAAIWWTRPRWPASCPTAMPSGFGSCSGGSTVHPINGGPWSGILREETLRWVQTSPRRSSVWRRPHWAQCRVHRLWPCLERLAVRTHPPLATQLIDWAQVQLDRLGLGEETHHDDACPDTIATAAEEDTSPAPWR